MSAAQTYIIFDLAGSSYGVRSSDVLHVDMLEHVTPVPNTHPAVDGVVFSRGKVIPALNLRVRFGLPRAPASSRTRLVFLKWQDRNVALVVDSAREFRALPSEAIRPIGETLIGIDGNYLLGVAKVNDRLVLLLDIAAVLDLSTADLRESVDASLQTSS
jgi:purine-binding chemotaxis protein CheW